MENRSQMQKSKIFHKKGWKTEEEKNKTGETRQKKNKSI
jgi:hypothetical protein